MVKIILEVDVLVVGDAHADETARTSGIHQGLLLVRGANERGVSAELLDGLAIGRTELHLCRRQQVLQHDLLRGSGLIKLVDIDHRKHRQCDIQVKLVLEVDLVVIVIAQFWRQDDLAETRLSATLTTNQQRRQRIASQLLIALAPLRYHADEPHPEILLPMGLSGGYARCQLFDIVVSVPLGQIVEPDVHGVILLDACRIDKAVHVSVPRFQTKFSGAHRHIVAYLLCQRLETLIVRVFFFSIPKIILIIFSII